MKSEGGKMTVERARKAAREGDTAPKPPKPKRLSREDIEYELRWLSESPPEINVEFYKGVHNALLWVLGLGSVWPARKRGGSRPEERSEEAVEVGADECAGQAEEAEDTPGSGDEQHPLPSLRRAVIGTPPRPEVGLPKEFRQKRFAGMKQEEVDAMRAERLAELDGVAAAKGEIEVFAYGLWEQPIQLPPDAELIISQDADKAGWCKDCPLATCTHVLMAIPGRPHSFSKYCPKPLLEQGLLDFDRLMESGGFEAGGDTYEQAKALLNLPAEVESV
jgi:hypothetical protein